MSDEPAVLQALAREAVTLVAEGARLGLGTGRAASAFIAALGERVRAEGLAVRAVATSAASTAEALAAGVPLASLEELLNDGGPLDATFDGADEVAPNLDLLKGKGGALVHERIVAAASRRQIILVGASKLVSALGEREALPIEIIRLARPLVEAGVRALGLGPRLRVVEAREGAREPFITENGNFILDCRFEQPLRDGLAARVLEDRLHALVGVVDTGLFLGTAERVLVGRPDGTVDVLRPPSDEARDATEEAMS